MSRFGDLPPKVTRDRAGKITGTGGPDYYAPDDGARTVTIKTVNLTGYGFEVTASESKEVMPANAARRYLLIQNTGAVDIRVQFGTAADTYNGMQIVPGGFYIAEFTVPVGSVNIIGDGGAGQGVIMEGV